MTFSSHGVIGGLFGFEPVSLAKGEQASPFAGSFVDYFLSARCAFYAVCQSVKPRIAWLPSYLCSAVLDPFRRLGIPVRYYDAGPNHGSGRHEWIADVHPGDLVLVIHYFGFANTTFPADQLKLRGAVIIEDASQSLFIKQQYPESVCIVYSPRKFFGVPDGGVLVTSRMDAIGRQPLEPPPTEWWKAAYAMTQMRREFDLIGGENRWFHLFRHVEETFPVGPYCSSDLARMLIETGTDYGLIRRARRQNYLVLSERVNEFALFPVLGEDTVPLGFPVCVDAAQRDAVLKCLYDEKIYPPVHWRIDGLVPEGHRESHLLSRRILTLICDQRYNICDMARQAATFLSAIS